MSGRRRDRHVINMMQSVYEQDNVSTEWRGSLIVPIILIKRTETSRMVGIAEG